MDGASPPGLSGSSDAVSENDPQRQNRPTAREIHDRAVADGRSELERPLTALGVSGLASGVLMGLSGLGVAELLAAGAPHAVAMLLYPLGFIAVIIGRAQLFTENTLYPVIVSLHDRRAIAPTLRLWGVVLAANIVGTLTFALLAMETGAAKDKAVGELAKLGVQATTAPFWDLFFSAVVGGWLVALAAWLVLASDATIGRIVVIFLLTYLIGVGSFEHVIATSAELLSAVVEGERAVGEFWRWFAAALTGNVVGGVVIVTLLNHGQVVSEH